VWCGAGSGVASGAAGRRVGQARVRRAGRMRSSRPGVEFLYMHKRGSAPPFNLPQRARAQCVRASAYCQRRVFACPRPMVFACLQLRDGESPLTTPQAILHSRDRNARPFRHVRLLYPQLRAPGRRSKVDEWLQRDGVVGAAALWLRQPPCACAYCATRMTLPAFACCQTQRGV